MRFKFVAKKEKSKDKSAHRRKKEKLFLKIRQNKREIKRAIKELESLVEELSFD
jgi:hypothetical protein